LVERLVRNEKVAGSIPVGSTILVAGWFLISILNNKSLFHKRNRYLSFVMVHPALDSPSMFQGIFKAVFVI
jgi:hypothetical protein